MKNINFFYSFFSFLISAFFLPVYANTEAVSTGEIDPPPPTTPIDNYVFIALILGVLYAGYYFYKSKSFKTNN